MNLSKEQFSNFCIQMGVLGYSVVTSSKVKTIWEKEVTEGTLTITYKPGKFPPKEDAFYTLDDDAVYFKKQGVLNEVKFARIAMIAPSSIQQIYGAIKAMESLV